MSGYGYDTSTATIRVTLPDGEIVEVTGANDGVNGYEWSARMVGNDLRLEVTVDEVVLIDGMQPAAEEEAKQRATCSTCLARTYRHEECVCEDGGNAEDYDEALADELREVDP